MSATESPEGNLATAKRYLQAIEGGATGEILAQFFTEDVVQEEYPNRLLLNGATRGLPEILRGAEQGTKIMLSQHYDIQHAVASGDDVVLEVRWTGTLAVPYDTIPAGGDMRARFAVFLRFRDGKIVRQGNYDCFEPW